MSEKRVFIEVTELRAISSDRDNWMLMKRTKKTDKETGKPTGGYSDWHSYKYPPTFEIAMASLERELQRTCGAQTFTELSRMSNQIHQHMLDTMEAAKLPSVET